MSVARNIASALAVAGSDSGGGAGIQADLRTFATLGVFGCSAIAALTSQNPFAVRRVDAVPVKGVVAQIDAVAEAFPIGAVKTGMLYSAQIVRAVAEALPKLKAPIVVDPVAVSTSGARLLKPDAVAALKAKLFPIASWITPNIPEAALLLSAKIRDERSMLDAARECESLWGCSVVVKAGHLEGSSKLSADIVCRKGKLYRLLSPRVKVRSCADHGTGCAFSAALAALLAKGLPWDKALLGAKAFILAALSAPVRISPELFSMYPPSGLPDVSAKVSLERIA